MPISTLEDRLAAQQRANISASGQAVPGSDLDKRIKAALASGKLRKDRVPQAVVAYAEKLQEEARGRRANLQGMVQARRDAMGNSGALAALRPVTSGLMNLGNSMSFGAAPVIGGALAGAIDPNRTMGQGIEDAKLQLEALSSPTAGAKIGDVAGTIGGAFVGPRAVVGRGVDALASLPFVGRAVQESKLGRGLFEIGKAATSGAAGVSASELIEGVASGRDAHQTLDRIQTGLMVSAPLAVASGGAAAAFRVSPSAIDRAGIDLLDRARRIMPNFRASPDMLRQGSEMQGFLRSLANVPGGRGLISKYVSQKVFAPIRDALDEMQRGIGPAQGASKAGKALSEIIPPEAARSFGTQRKNLWNAAYQSDGQTIINPDLWTGILRALGSTNLRARQALGSEGGRGSDMSDIVGRIRMMNRKFQGELHAAKAAGRNPSIGVKIQDLENLRQAAGQAAGFDSVARSARELGSVSERDARDAKVIYHAVTQAMRQESPAVDQAFNAAKALRAAQKELEPMVGAARNFDPDQLVAQVFNNRKPIRTLRMLRQKMSSSENSALAGAYVGDFLRSVSRDESGGKRLLGPTMRNLFNGNGRFRAPLFDEVVGSSKQRRQLLDLAEILDRTAPARREGSPTAGRLMDTFVAGGVINLPKLALDVMHDPDLGKGWAARTAMIPFSYMMLKSVLEGGLSRDLERLATGGIARSPTTTAGALSEASNMVFQNRGNNQ